MITSASALSVPGLASGRCAGLEGVEDDLGQAGANQERHQERLKWGHSGHVIIHHHGIFMVLSRYYYGIIMVLSWHYHGTWYSIIRAVYETAIATDFWFGVICSGLFLFLHKSEKQQADCSSG